MGEVRAGWACPGTEPDGVVAFSGQELPAAYTRDRALERLQVLDARGELTSGHVRLMSSALGVSERTGTGGFGFPAALEASPRYRGRLAVRVAYRGLKRG